MYNNLGPLFCILLLTTSSLNLVKGTNENATTAGPETAPVTLPVSEDDTADDDSNEGVVPVEGHASKEGASHNRTTTLPQLANITGAPIATNVSITPNDGQKGIITEAGKTTRKPSSGGSGSYSGDGTYYDIGMGACGKINTNEDLVAAVSQPVYGVHANPNNAPICGKCALIKYGSKSVKITIVDKCMGCKTGDIDMSPAAFKQLADQALGRIKVTWTMVSC